METQGISGLDILAVVCMKASYEPVCVNKNWILFPRTQLRVTWWYVYYISCNCLKQERCILWRKNTSP